MVYVMWTVVTGPLTNASLVAQAVKCLPIIRRPRFNPWVRKISWRRKWQPTPVFLPGKSQGWRNLVGSMGLQRAGYDWVTSLSFLSFWPMFSNALLKLFLQCSYIREISHLLAIRFAYSQLVSTYTIVCLVVDLCCFYVVLYFYSISCNRICNAI